MKHPTKWIATSNSRRCCHKCVGVTPINNDYFGGCLDSILHSQVVRSTLSSSMRQLHQFFVINSGPILWSKLFASNFVQRLFYWNSSRDVLWTSFEVNWCSGLALPRARASTNKPGVPFFVVRDCQIPLSVWPLLANTLWCFIPVRQVHMIRCAKKNGSAWCAELVFGACDHDLRCCGTFVWYNVKAGSR